MMSKDDYVAQHFPTVNPSARPTGNQILVQLRAVKEKTAGGIVLVEDTKEYNNGNTQVGMLVKVGQIAFKDRSSGETWKEGAWAEVGDICIFPRWGGFRYEIEVPGSSTKAIFAIFEDFNVKMVVDSNFEAFDKLL